MTITKDMTIGDVLRQDADKAEVFLSFGMHCLGCPVSQGETVEQASAAHGIDINELITKLNEE